MKWITVFILLSTIITAQADQLYLQDGQGKEHGPFELKPGKKIDLKNRELFISRIVPEKQHQLIEKMSEIVIPKLEFKEPTLQGVVDFFNEASIKHDKTGKGVNIILDIDEKTYSKEKEAKNIEDDPFAVPLKDKNTKEDSSKKPKSGASLKPTPIMHSARNITLLEALNIITDICDLKYRIIDNSVVICSKNAPDGDIVIRMFDVMGTFSEIMRPITSNTCSNCDNFITMNNSHEETEDWKRFFAEMGVGWPDGSRIRHVPSIGKLIVANTRKNILTLESVLKISGVVSTQIEIEFQLLAFDRDAIEEIASERITLETLTDLWKKKKGRLLASPTIITQAGVEATIKGVVENIYPTKYKIASDQKTNTTFLTTGSIIQPSSFETREVGSLMSILPEISSEGQMINITITTEDVANPEWHKYEGKYENAKGETKSFTIEQPFFETFTLSTTISLTAGTKILMGGGTLSRDKKSFNYCFLSARLIDTKGKEVNPTAIETEYELP